MLTKPGDPRRHEDALQCARRPEATLRARDTALVPVDADAPQRVSRDDAARCLSDHVLLGERTNERHLLRSGAGEAEWPLAATMILTVLGKL